MKDFYELNEEPSPAQWRELFRLGSAVYNLKPWESLDETSTFGVTDPTTGTIGYPVVMGSNGEHFGLTIFLGAGAFNSIQNILLCSVPPEPRDMLAMRQVQVTFEQRDYLHPADVKAENKYMLAKLKGRNSHITFRAIRPFYHPWLITADDAALLIGLLKPIVEVLPRVIENPDGYLVEDDDVPNFTCVHFISEDDGDGRTWLEERRAVEDEPEDEIEVEATPELVEAVKALPKGGAVEIAYVDFGEIVVDDFGRPFEPEMMLIVDAKSMAVLKFDMHLPVEGTEAYEVGRCQRIVDAFADLPFRPSQIRIDDVEISDLLEKFAKQIGVKLKVVEELPGIDEVVEAMADRHNLDDLSLDE